MTPDERRLLLLTAELQLVNAAVARLDRFGMAAQRPELVSAELRNVLAKREALCREVHAARERVIAGGG